MKNRKAWGLVAMIAVVLLFGGTLAAYYQGRQPKAYRWVTLLPRPAWGFGPDPLDFETTVEAHGVMEGNPQAPLPERYKVGCFSVRVK